MRWDDLQLFLAVARSGSFTAAARELGLQQSTVSRRIAALEESLGAMVFDRSRGRPTPVGEGLRSRVERMEAEMAAFQAELASFETAPEGLVRLAVAESIAVHVVVPRVLPELDRRAPKVRLQLIISDAPSELGPHDAEIALRFFRPTGGDLTVRRVAVLPTAIVGRAEHQGLAAEALPWIAHEGAGREDPENRWYWTHVAREPQLVAGSFVAQIEAVRAGLGVALLPLALTRVYPSLVALELGLPPGPVLELWLVCPSSLRRVPRIDAVWSVLDEVFASLA